MGPTTRRMNRLEVRLVREHKCDFISMKHGSVHHGASCTRPSVSEPDHIVEVLTSVKGIPHAACVYASRSTISPLRLRVSAVSGIWMVSLVWCIDTT